MRNTTQISRTFAIAAGLLIGAGIAAPAPVAHSSAEPAVTRLGQAVSAYEKHDYFTTVHLLSAAGQPAQLRDYVVYYLANAELVTNNGAGALRDFDRYASSPVPGSPLAGRIDLLYAKALLGEHSATVAASSKARQILQADYALLPQPDGDFTLAQAFEATGFPRQAVVYYQHVYYSHPAADLAEQARQALEKLRPSLGGDYPEASARLQLERPNAWLAAKQFVKARQEFAVLVTTLAGGGRDAAQTGVGAALYLNNDYADAVSYLSNLHPDASNPEAADADAERLYYLTEAYRHENDDTSMLAAVHELGDKYPQSSWRLKALISAGNYYLLAQDPSRYVPLYQAAANSFPGDSSAALCQWRVAWAAWLDHGAQREELLKQQIEKFPSDTHVSDALFFLGRATEQDSDFSAARTYYERLNTYFPHYYYAALARTRLAEPKLAAVKEDPAIRAWLEKTAGAAHYSALPADTSATPNDATSRRIDRGRLLIIAGMTTQAVDELEYGVKQGDEQPTLLAMELSRSMPTPYLAVRVMKRFSGDYLSLPFDKASRAFWEMLFPMPYRETLTASASERDLDPYAVAGLIRQESEFNPAARSAFALGLMQLRPGTGKMMGRSDGIRVSIAGLLNPALNIRLGTQYLRTELDHWEGDWVKTLAAYNAGPGRVRDWLAQYGYGDSAEFIENIPFSETRDYVQAVLRNGQVYRELYGNDRDKLLLASDSVDSSAVPPVRIAKVALSGKTAANKPAKSTNREAAGKAHTKVHSGKTSARAAKRKPTGKPAVTAGKGTASARKGTASARKGTASARKGTASVRKHPTA